MLSCHLYYTLHSSTLFAQPPSGLATQERAVRLAFCCMGSEGYAGKKGMLILLEKLLCLLHDQMFKERILTVLVYVVKKVMSGSRQFSYVTGSWCGTAWECEGFCSRVILLQC